MAAKDSDSRDVKKQEELDDITTCCICTEVYTDPKALPCIHTFCMKCIEETGLKTNKGPGDEMPCPICRRLFKIPSEGFPGLPKHFFIERLIQVSKVSDSSAVTKALCSLCFEESKEQTGKDTPRADTYCVDCKYNLCEECCSEHRNFRATKNHKLIPIHEYESGQNVIANLALMVCEVHDQKVLDVFCADCKIVACAICFIEEHNNHKGSHIIKCLDGFRKQIQNNTEAINGCIAEAQMKKAELLKVKEQMEKRVESLECVIENRREQIKQFTDKHANCLLKSLCSERQSRSKEIQITTDDTDAYLANLESYKSYCQRLLAKGSASDICSALSDLSIRAFELQQQCQPIIERGILDFKFCFTQSELKELLEEDFGNLIGVIEKDGDLKPKKTSKQSLLAEQSKEIDILRKENGQLKHELDAVKATNNSLRTSNDKFVKELNIYKATVRTLETNVDKLRKEFETTKAVELRYKSDAALVHTIRTKASDKGKKSSNGLAIFGKELFVASANSSEVEVYDSVKLSFSRRWNLKELNDPWDIGSCNRSKCLYIIDFKVTSQSTAILRVDPNGKLMKYWQTGDDLGYGLSVTDESNVLLTVYNKNKFNEYSPDGQLIREIRLSSEAGRRIHDPWHAMKLINGHFLVSHGLYDGDLHRVCIVDADGKLVKSFGGKCGSTIGQVKTPVYLSVDANGYVLIADYGNSRALLLDSDLEFKREILSKEKHGIKNPWRILLDRANGRLFVADDKRILIFDFK